MERFRGLEQVSLSEEKKDEKRVSDFDEFPDTGRNGKKSKMPKLEYPDSSSREYRTADEDERLGNVSGDYKKEIEENPLLTEEEELFYIRMFQGGTEEESELAKKVLIESNLRLVISIANKYFQSKEMRRDSIQEGIFGLEIAMEKFDIKRGNRLSTYATWWIRQKISRYMSAKDNLVYKPNHIMESIVTLNKETKKLTDKLGYEPTVQQLAEETKFSIADINNLRRLAEKPSSLDVSAVSNKTEKSFGDKKDKSIYEVLPDKTIRGTEEEIKKWSLEQDVERWISNAVDLTDRERQILRWRYTDDEQLTFEEIGDRLGVHRNRAHQLEKIAIKKLRKQGFPSSEQIAEE